MESERLEIIQRRIIHYACGCTTTRIQVEHRKLESLPVCAGHELEVIKEELTTEYRTLAIDEKPGQANQSLHLPGPLRFP